MGDVAEMMLDGTLCEGCGAFLNDEAPGYPCYCDDCAKDYEVSRNPPSKKCSCGFCGKRVKEAGLKDHMRDAHGVKP